LAATLAEIRFEKGVIMKAAIALILEGEAHAAVRRTTLELLETCQLGLRGVQLPAHVSLKQPFKIDNLLTLEAYFDTFARSLEPIPLTLTTLEFWHHEPLVIAYLDVLEDDVLRPLHERLNAELEARFGDTNAPFDGDAYHFHATVTMDHANPAALREQAARAGQRFDLSTKASLLGLFVYTDDEFAPLSYIMYKMVRLREPRGDSR
jgi:2'-5' RNA ligase